MSGLSTKDNGSANREAEAKNLKPDAPVKEPSGDAPEITGILSHLAHDLRSPLNTIIGFSDVLYSGRMGKLNTSQKKQLRIILDRGTELLALFDDLIEYSRVLSHRTEICVTTISLNSLLKNAVERLRTTLSEEEVELSYEVPGSPLRIKGEERKLAHLFQSIVLDGAGLIRPREIRVTVEDHTGETGAGPGTTATATVAFLHGARRDPEQFLNWDMESDVPGTFRFHIYLARFYLRAMGGELSVTSEGDSNEFQLHLCKVPL